MPEATTFDIDFGSSGSAYLTEILNPAADRFLAVLKGNVVGNFTLSGGQPEGGEFEYVLDTAAANLAPGKSFRADSTIGTPAMPFESVVTFLPNGDARLTLAGPFRTASNCGSGEGSIITNTPLVTDGNTGQTKAGELAISSGGATTTYRYNADGTVTITAGGQSQTFTQAELSALCDL